MILAIVASACLGLAGAGLSVTLGWLTTMVILSSAQTVFDSFRTWATGSLQRRGWDVQPVVSICLLAGAAITVFFASSLAINTQGGIR